MSLKRFIEALVNDPKEIFEIVVQIHPVIEIMQDQ